MNMPVTSTLGPTNHCTQQALQGVRFPSPPLLQPGAEAAVSFAFPGPAIQAQPDYVLLQQQISGQQQCHVPMTTMQLPVDLSSKHSGQLQFSLPITQPEPTYQHHLPNGFVPFSNFQPFHQPQSVAQTHHMFGSPSVLPLQGGQTSMQLTLRPEHLQTNHQEQVHTPSPQVYGSQGQCISQEPANTGHISQPMQLPHDHLLMPLGGTSQGLGVKSVLVANSGQQGNTQPQNQLSYPVPHMSSSGPAAPHHSALPALQSQHLQQLQQQQQRHQMLMPRPPSASVRANPILSCSGQPALQGGQASPLPVPSNPMQPAPQMGIAAGGGQMEPAATQTASLSHSLKHGSEGSQLLPSVSQPPARSTSPSTLNVQKHLFMTRPPDPGLPAPTSQRRTRPQLDEAWRERVKTTWSAFPQPLKIAQDGAANGMDKAYWLTPDEALKVLMLRKLASQNQQNLVAESLEKLQTKVRLTLKTIQLDQERSNGPTGGLEALGLPKLYRAVADSPARGPSHAAAGGAAAAAPGATNGSAEAPGTSSSQAGMARSDPSATPLEDCTNGAGSGRGQRAPSPDPRHPNRSVLSTPWQDPASSPAVGIPSSAATNPGGPPLDAVLASLQEARPLSSLLQAQTSGTDEALERVKAKAAAMDLPSLRAWLAEIGTTLRQGWPELYEQAIEFCSNRTSSSDQKTAKLQTLLRSGCQEVRHFILVFQAYGGEKMKVQARTAAEAEATATEAASGKSEQQQRDIQSTEAPRRPSDLSTLSLAEGPFLSSDEMSSRDSPVATETASAQHRDAAHDPTTIHREGLDTAEHTMPDGTEVAGAGEQLGGEIEPTLSCRTAATYEATGRGASDIDERRPSVDTTVAAEESDSGASEPALHDVSPTAESARDEAEAEPPSNASAVALSPSGLGSPLAESGAAAAPYVSPSSSGPAIAAAYEPPGTDALPRPSTSLRDVEQPRQVTPLTATGLPPAVSPSWLDTAGHPGTSSVSQASESPHIARNSSMAPVEDCPAAVAGSKRAAPQEHSGSSPHKRPDINDETAAVECSAGPAPVDSRGNDLQVSTSNMACQDVPSLPNGVGATALAAGNAGLHLFRSGVIRGYGEEDSDDEEIEI